MFFLMDYLFFHLYNRMYQDGKFARNMPEWNALALIVIGSCIWLMLIFECYFFYYLNINLPQNFRLMAFSMAIILFLVGYFAFIYKRRFNRIYSHYKNRNKIQQKIGLSISLIFVFLPIVITAIITLSWHGKI